ncbi:hypothetical protein ABK040_009201 [Willaertia magna]
MCESNNNKELLNNKLLPERRLHFEKLKEQSDCLELILQFIDPFECVSKFSIVCKDWMEIIQKLNCKVSLPNLRFEKFQIYNQFYKSKFFNNVQEITMNGFDCEIVKKIINCTKCVGLKKLLLYNCKSKGAFTIAECENMSKLTSLIFINSRIHNIGANKIVESEKLFNLKELELPRCKVNHQFALTLSKKMLNLTTLNLEGNNLKAEGVKYLSFTTTLKNLTYLNLKRNKIGKEGAHYLSTSQFLTNLKHLNLEGNSIENEGLIHICNSSNLTILSTLNLSGNLIDDEGIKIFVHCPNFKNLKKLFLANARGNLNFRIREIKNNYSLFAISIMANSLFLKNLVYLELVDDCLDKEGAQRLCEMAPGLSYLLDDFIEEEDIEYNNYIGEQYNNPNDSQDEKDEEEN